MPVTTDDVIVPLRGRRRVFSPRTHSPERPILVDVLNIWWKNTNNPFVSIVFTFCAFYIEQRTHFSVLRDYKFDARYPRISSLNILYPVIFSPNIDVSRDVIYCY